ncbi:unnamed protein product [Phyllotreta striolata]|uniref:Capon-like protein n=1 Tax=Phyllotreta striolata TaxID=444603 RepID=A0A9P0GMP4_PHYSR|nr:unnamed protein product [Phyllotreta striolata]
MTNNMLKRAKDDSDALKKKPDVLTKAKLKFFNIGEAFKSNKTLSAADSNQPKRGMVKSNTQVNFEQYYRKSPQIYHNPESRKERKSNLLHKQTSIDSYPIKIKITDENDEVICSATKSNLCLDKLEAPPVAEALALEKPRKKLSFKLPEIVETITNNRKLSIGGLRHRSGSYKNIRDIIEKASAKPQALNRTASFNGVLEKEAGFDDAELESQAMRVVRTVGQAFEVCHKLSINNPENDHLDQDEQDTLTQDLLSDRLSDITSDKPKRDILSEGASDRVSLPPDDCSFRDLDTGKCTRTTGQLDVLPPPPNNVNSKNIILKSAEMYSSPLSDGLTTGSGESGGSLPPPGTALSTHHELQLMREQLEQQTQQTQAALAQLQLAREQLAAEQAARLEAQARTHQLLIHNRELLDHIAALVGHLQGSEKSGQQPTPPHMTMPQQQTPNGTSSSDMYEYADAANSMNFNLPGLPENRSSGSFVPASPLRSSFNPAGNVFNFAYPQSLEAATFENQLLQKLQALNALQPSNPFAYPFSQSVPYLLPNLYSPTLNGNFSLQNPPQKNVFARPFAGGRHSEPRQFNPNYFNQSPPSKKDEYYTKQGSDTYQQKESDSPIYQKIIPKSEAKAEASLRESSPNPLYQTITPRKQGEDSSKAKTQEKCQDRRPFIKPHSQMGTLTTTDADGRLRVVVPVLSNSREDLSESFGNLRTDDRYKSLPRASDKCYYKSSNQQNTLVRHKTK